MVGRTLDHYRIVSRLGAGGMGIVYRAHDEKLKRDVALKLLPEGVLTDDAARKRFHREALALSHLNHPHICTIFEIGDAGGQTYIAMEYVEGSVLSEAIPSGGLPVETVLRRGGQIADALSHAHEKGLLHRDLKCSNVMVTKREQIKLLDFGLVKQIASAPTAETQTLDDLTEPGAIVGTLAYMAPESLRGRNADVRTDIWALGVILHEMLAGKRPFHGKTQFDLTSAILNEPAPALPERVPEWLRRITQKCLAKEPGERYQSAAELRGALDVAAGGIDAPRTGIDRRWWLAAAAAAAGAAAVWRGSRFFNDSRETPIESLAVLPFDNLSKDPDQDYFATGMTEQLITDLSKIRALRVISRTSVSRFQGASKPPIAKIAAELGVDAVVEGSVMRSGNQVRITAQLIRASSDKHLWAESYDRDLSEVLGLQREVARTISSEIRITVTPQEQASLAGGRRVDPEVHQLVLRGNYYVDKGTEEGLQKAASYFEQAAAKDPNFAPAHAGVALAYRSLANVFVAPREVMPKARAAVDKALALDDSLADAHTTLAAILLFYDWDWPQAERHIQRALELNPSLATAHLLYGNYFTALGRPEEALAEIRLAQKLDPLSLLVQNDILFCMISARQFDETIAQAQRTTAREPTFAAGYVAAALAYGEKGEFDRGLAEMEKALKIEDNTTFQAMHAHLHAAKGNRKEAERILEALKVASKQRYVCAYEVAHAYVKMGEKRQAFEWLEKGKRDRADCMVWLLSEPWMDPLRREQQYKELIAHIGLGNGKSGARP